MYCVCDPGRLDESGIEVYIISKTSILLHTGIKPADGSPFVKVVCDNDNIYCSNALGFVY